MVYYNHFYDYQSGSSVQWVECSPVVWETSVQSQVASYCNILTSYPAGQSDEKCTCVNHRCIRSKISGDQGITLTVDELNWEQMWRSQEVGGRQIIILTRRQEVQISWRKDVGIRTMSQQRLGPRPPVEQPRRTGKKCCYGQKSRGHYVAVVFSLQLTSHTIIPFVTLSNPFE